MAAMAVAMAGFDFNISLNVVATSRPLNKRGIVSFNTFTLPG
jgi:hypothetical protein